MRVPGFPPQHNRQPSERAEAILEGISLIESQEMVNFRGGAKGHLGGCQMAGGRAPPPTSATRFSGAAAGAASGQPGRCTPQLCGTGGSGGGRGSGNCRDDVLRSITSMAWGDIQ